jgi:thiamine biosynthesis lipoprotein
MVRRVEEIWGTVVSIDVRDPIDEHALDECYAWFRRVDDLFSTWRDDTEVMRIGRGELAIADASDDVRTVLAACDEMHLESNGAFDITVGARARVARRPGLAPLDPSGFVKGWAVERAAAQLRNAGAQNYTIYAGGDVLTRGHPKDADRWRVGIQHPWERDRVATVLEIADGAVATSGRYERGDHVISPATGLPALDLASVTVVGPDLGIADAYATAAVVLGPSEGLRWLTTRVGYEGMAITDTRAVLLTPGFDRYRAS